MSIIRRYRRYVLHVLLIVVGLYSALYIIQRQVLFCGIPRVPFTPAAYRIPFEPFIAHGEDTEVHGWFLPSSRGAGVVLFCHGGGGNIAEHFDLPRRMLKRGVSVATFDYAGSGESTGRASEAQMNRDARAAWDYLVNERGISPRKIVVWGQSFGSGPACDLAAQVHPAGLIVEAGFFSLAYEYFGAAGKYLGWLVPYNFNNAAHLKALATPVLIVHSKDDEVYSIDGARALFEIAKSPKEFHATVGSHYAYPGTDAAQAAFDKAVDGFLARTVGVGT